MSVCVCVPVLESVSVPVSADVFVSIHYPQTLPSPPTIFCFSIPLLFCQVLLRDSPCVASWFVLFAKNISSKIIYDKAECFVSFFLSCVL